MFMSCSVEKIRAVNDFLVNKAGLKQSNIARCPNLYLASLERRLIPRCAVRHILMSKGLLPKDLDTVWMLNGNKKYFEQRFLAKYEGNVPELAKAYFGEMEGSMDRQ